MGSTWAHVMGIQHFSLHGAEGAHLEENKGHERHGQIASELEADDRGIHHDFAEVLVEHGGGDVLRPVKGR